MSVIGVGGKTPEEALATLSDMTGGVLPIQPQEFQERLAKAHGLMTELGFDAVYLNAGTNLYYFTGTKWNPSERMVGALLISGQAPAYIAPAFEESTLQQFMDVDGPVHTWDEHESPYGLISKILASHGVTQGKLGLDESTPYFVANGISKACPEYRLENAVDVTAGCRMVKSETELALMQRAKDMTLRVHKATAAMLSEGISTTEVGAFINEAHKKVGATAGSYFKIVLFGEATAYPHGVKEPQILKDGDMVLIDTGCQLHGYISDITRSYVYGTPTDRQRDVWEAEKAAQAVAFDAAQIGVRAGDVDLAARKELETRGFGPGYNTPGLPHRTGHGIGLDIHEWPYLNSGDNTPLAPGMCFSNEPMICVYSEFGVRLEDHFYMSSDGPVWFTEPSHSFDDPFKGVA